MDVNQLIEYGFKLTTYEHSKNIGNFYNKKLTAEKSPFKYYVDLGYMDADEDVEIEIYQKDGLWFIQGVAPHSTIEHFNYPMDSEDGIRIYNETKTV